MKKILVAALISLVQISAIAGANYKKLFKVTVINLTKGQPLTPPVIAVHSPKYTLVHLGEAASQGLGQLATDGKVQLLQQELAMEKLVKRSKVGSGVIMPGQRQDIVVEANDPRYKFSVVSMLARTNDAIVVSQGLTTHLAVGQKAYRLAYVYDAGVEANSESCMHIPAPPCDNPGQGLSGEGYVRPHEGLINVGDLDPRRDAFANASAKIIVERIQ